MARVFRTRNRFLLPFAFFTGSTLLLDRCERLGYLRVPSLVSLSFAILGFACCLLWAWEAERPMSKPDPDADQGTPIEL